MANDLDHKKVSCEMKCFRLSIIVETLLAIWILLSIFLLLAERHFLLRLVCKEWPDDILC